MGRKDVLLVTYREGEPGYELRSLLEESYGPEELQEVLRHYTPVGEVEVLNEFCSDGGEAITLFEMKGELYALHGTKDGFTYLYRLQRVR